MQIISNPAHVSVIMCRQLVILSFDARKRPYRQVTVGWGGGREEEEDGGGGGGG